MFRNEKKISAPHFISAHYSNNINRLKEREHRLDLSLVLSRENENTYDSEYETSDVLNNLVEKWKKK